MNIYGVKNCWFQSALEEIAIEVEDKISRRFIPMTTKLWLMYNVYNQPYVFPSPGYKFPTNEILEFRKKLIGGSNLDIHTYLCKWYLDKRSGWDDALILCDLKVTINTDAENEDVDQVIAMYQE